MTAPNRNTLWGRVVVEELVAAGVTAACISPGSRSTPLTVALTDHDDVEVFSVLDERSAAFFALGRGRQTGEPTAVVSTSGTAAVNFHPAVVEAHQSRAPLVVLTADRPPELRDSGANQTIDQTDLYGDAVRFQRTLPEPAPEPRKLRSLRTAVCRAAAAATGVPPGPVHLDCPFRKPLEPVEVPADSPHAVPDDLAERAPLAVHGRDGPFVATTRGRPAVDDAALTRVVEAVTAADRGLIVAGPADVTPLDADPVADLAAATGFPILADPLSGLRFGDHLDRDGVTVCGGYDSYLDAADDWPTPEMVVRFGASPTSKVLRHYLRDQADRQFVVDPAGGWREATFTATDLVAADPSWLARAVADCVGSTADPSAFRDRFATVEAAYWDHIERARDAKPFEGAVIATVADRAPDPATLFVSNSMPVRDLDRFARPAATDLTALGNRGASGIDGITSTALGAGSAIEDPLVVVTGDLAYFHDTTGLFSVARCSVDATIVLLNNDGGGIFHRLPIEDFDPPFTDQFKTPHGLDFEPTGDLYELDFERVSPGEAFADAYDSAVSRAGTTVLEVQMDAEDSHRTRDAIHADVCEAVDDWVAE
jgi:2-succinyl-5-enolpyruvyl-6-hydroxy-3-cyclohexene-1-carboxylate synthase